MSAPNYVEITKHLENKAHKLRKDAKELKEESTKLTNAAKAEKAQNRVYKLLEQAKECKNDAENSEKIATDIDEVVSKIRSKEKKVIEDLKAVNEHIKHFQRTEEICNPLKILIKKYFLEKMKPYSDYWADCGKLE